MRDFLDEIVPVARASIAGGYYEQCPKCACGKRSLANAVKKASARGEVAIISEIKPASPSKGALLAGGFDAGAIAKEMELGGADAISVLAEPVFFKGSLQNVALAKKSTRLPILFKDFVFDEAQLRAAKRAGADCVLLIYALFGKLYGKNCGKELRKMIALAHGLGLEVLLETHSHAEFAEGKKFGADLAGINNRDLRSLEIDLRTTQKILGAEGAGKLLIVSESGFETRKQVIEAQKAGAGAVLVGTSIAKSGNIAEKIVELKGLQK